MTRWAGEMEFDFVQQGDAATEGSFVTTGKVVNFIRNHLGKNEIEHAARLYEQSGGAIAGALLEDAKASSISMQRAMAEMFVFARDFGTAAQLFELGRKLPDAARLYEQSGDFSSAARCFLKDGDNLRAAAALERAGQPQAAMELYAKAGAEAALAECLARQQRHWEAAQIYQRINNLRSEVEMLRVVPLADPNRISAVKRLSALLAQHGHLQQGAQLIVDTVRALPNAQRDMELQLQLVQMMEALGQVEQAAKFRAHLERLFGQALGPASTSSLAALPPAMEVVPPTKTITGVAIQVVTHVEPVAEVPKARDPFSQAVDPFGGGATTGTTPPADAYAFLKNIPIFAALTLSDMKDLYRLCQEISAMPGTTLIEQGVPGSGLTIVLDGEVQVLRVEPNGGTTPLAVLGRGKYVGEISLVDDALTTARVAAKGMVRGLFLPKEKFEHYLYSHAAAALEIYRLFTKTLGERLRAANQRK